MEEPTRSTPDARPIARSATWLVLSTILMLGLWVVALGSNFQSSPYSEHQKLMQGLNLGAAFLLFLACILAVGFPRIRLGLFLATVAILVLLYMLA